MGSEVGLTAVRFAEVILGALAEEQKVAGGPQSSAEVLFGAEDFATSAIFSLRRELWVPIQRAIQSGVFGVDGHGLHYAFSPDGLGLRISFSTLWLDVGVYWFPHGLFNEAWPCIPGARLTDDGQTFTDGQDYDLSDENRAVVVFRQGRNLGATPVYDDMVYGRHDYHVSANLAIRVFAAAVLDLVLSGRG